jgi:excisionase family DNA binding protein
MIEFLKNRTSYPDDLEVWQVAEILGCAQRYVYQLLKQRQIKHYRVGKRIFVDTDDLVRFIESKVVNAQEVE